MYVAAENGNVNVVDLLLLRGGSVNTENKVSKSHQLPAVVTITLTLNMRLVDFSLYSSGRAPYILRLRMAMLTSSIGCYQEEL